MNQTLRYNFANDTLVNPGAFVAAMNASSFLRKFSSDRLKAFKTRFSPSSETFGQKLSNLAVTAGIYAAAAFVIREVSTANIAPLLHIAH